MLLVSNEVAYLCYQRIGHTCQEVLCLQMWPVDSGLACQTITITLKSLNTRFYKQLESSFKLSGFSTRATSKMLLYGPSPYRRSPSHTIIKLLVIHPFSYVHSHYSTLILQVRCNTLTLITFMAENKITITPRKLTSLKAEFQMERTGGLTTLDNSS